MDEFMRSILGSAWGYYIAFGILFVWWLGYLTHKD